MCQKQAVKFSHVIHIRSKGGCEEEEEEEEEGVGEGGLEGRREGEERRGAKGRRGGRHKGWSDAVAVIKPASTNTDSEHTLHARISKVHVG